MSTPSAAWRSSNGSRRSMSQRLAALDRSQRLPHRRLALGRAPLAGVGARQVLGDDGGLVGCHDEDEPSATRLHRVPQGHELVDGVTDVPLRQARVLHVAAEVEPIVLALDDPGEQVVEGSGASAADRRPARCSRRSPAPRRTGPPRAGRSARPRPCAAGGGRCSMRSCPGRTTSRRPARGSRPRDGSRSAPLEHPPRTPAPAGTGGPARSRRQPRAVSTGRTAGAGR